MIQIMTTKIFDGDAFIKYNQVTQNEVLDYTNKIVEKKRRYSLAFSNIWKPIFCVLFIF